MTSRIFPRSPYARLGGYVHLPRFIDKVKLHSQGLLLGYNYKSSGFDRHLLLFLGIEPDRFESVVTALGSDEHILQWLRAEGVAHTPAEIDAWNQSMIAKQPDTPEKRNRFAQILRQVGGTEGLGVTTYFDLIDFEERRMEWEARRAREAVPGRNGETERRSSNHG